MGQQIEIFNKDITAAVAATAVDYGLLPVGTRGLTLFANFTYGSSGTSAKAYVQTSFDGGTTWADIACFAFTTSSLKKIANLRANTPVTTVATPTDGSLADNTTVDGILGDRIRVKYVTTGTYAGTTNLTISAVAHG